jgi:1,4-alpha-glucan branching enzyme
MSDADAVICVSSASVDESITSLGLSATHLSVIPNAIVVNPLPSISTVRGVDVTFVGRLVPEKGVDVLIQAVADLRLHFPKVIVNIIGDGPLRHELEQQVVNLELSTNVQFIGQLDRVDVNNVLMTSKILVLPSRKESFGIVLLEAANAGCAVVATSTGGIPSIIESGRNGILVEKDSSVELAQCLRKLLSEESTRLELVREFHERLQYYDVKSFVARYRSVFAEVVSR